MFEPKYPKGHLNKIIIGNLENHIGICTLWTPPEKITNGLNKTLFCIAGQLVTKNRGISAIIRNCLLHGAITDIVVLGADLTGTRNALKSFIEKGIDESYKIIDTKNAEIEREIPIDAIELFRKNVNLHFVDELDNSFLKLISKKPRYANENKLEFEEHKIQKPKSLPSENIIHTVRAKTIAEAWPEILMNVRRFGKVKPSRHGEMQEIHQLSVEITDENTEEIIWNNNFTFTKEELENYYPQVCTKNPVSNLEYTYGKRIFDFEGINQINYAIEMMRKDFSSRYAYVSLWNPLKDSVSGKDQPCLTAINFLVQNENILNMSAWIRSNDMWAAWPSNAFALRRLQEIVAKELGFNVGSLVTNSMSAHVYSPCFEKADEIIQKRKINYLEKDKHGDLVIFLSDDKINLIHKDRDGNEIGNYKGRTAKELLMRIVSDKLINKTSHAIYIGIELQKAEIALENDIEYIQDKKLSLQIQGKRKGKLIVLDGTDGSGKATQTKLLVEMLKKDGYAVEVTDFPQYGQKSAAFVEDYLNGKFGSAKEVGPYRASIFYACDRYASSSQIKKWLEQGKIVISNRYTSANMGHQTGKIKDAEQRNSFLEWLDNLEFKIFEIPRPDINIFLYVPPEIGQVLVKNKEKREYIEDGTEDIHEKDLTHLKEASDAYKYVAEKFNWTTIKCAPDGTINSLKTPEQIHEEIRRHIKERFGI